MSAAIKLSPEVYSEVAELGVKLIIGAIAKRHGRPAESMTDDELLDGARAFVAEYQGTDAVIAEERRRLGAEDKPRNPEAAGTVDEHS